MRIGCVDEYQAAGRRQAVKGRVCLVAEIVQSGKQFLRGTVEKFGAVGLVVGDQPFHFVNAGVEEFLPSLLAQRGVLGNVIQARMSRKYQIGDGHRASQSPQRSEVVAGVASVQWGQLRRVRAERTQRACIAQRLDHISREQDLQAVVLDEITDTSRAMTGGAEHRDAALAEREYLVALQLHVHRGRTSDERIHLEGAHQRFSWTARAENRAVGSSGVHLCPGPRS